MKNSITQEGIDKLKSELQKYKKERPLIIKEIEIARGHGDLSENAEYDMARQRQAYVESRIQELNKKLTESRIVDVSNISTDKAHFGTVVTVKNFKINKNQTYTLVSETESEPKEGRISCASPLGQALLDKSVGDIAEFSVGENEIEMEILKIERMK